MKTITLADLASKLQSPARPVLIEALPPRYFEQGHLPGALNINIGEAKELAAQLLPQKDAEIVVYCASQSCTNSDQVAIQLHALGYGNVAIFKGGKAEWQQAGLALEGVPAGVASED